MKSGVTNEQFALEEVGAKSDLPCPVCGGRSYSWGMLHASGIKFIPESASILEKAFQIGFRMSARRCDHCGNIQLFAPAHDADS